MHTMRMTGPPCKVQGDMLGFGGGVGEGVVQRGMMGTGLVALASVRLEERRRHVHWHQEQGMNAVVDASSTAAAMAVAGGWCIACKSPVEHSTQDTTSLQHTVNVAVNAQACFATCSLMGHL